MLICKRMAQLGLVAAGLSLAAGTLHAATVHEDFESYEVGQTLHSQNNVYSDNADAKIQQDALDTVNNTRVLKQDADSTDTGALNLTGRIQLSLDMKFPDNTTPRNIYLYQSGDDRPLYIQVRSDNRLAVRAGHATQANHYLTTSYQADQWYRVTATIYLDPNNGANSTIETADLYTLKAGGEIDQHVGHLADLEAYGNPTQVDFSRISGTGIFDNWQVTQVPEPAAISLLGLGGLLLMRRKK